MVKIGTVSLVVLTITRGLATSVKSELTSERNLAMFLDNSQISDPNVQLLRFFAESNRPCSGL